MPLLSEGAVDLGLRDALVVEPPGVELQLHARQRPRCTGLLTPVGRRHAALRCELLQPCGADHNAQREPEQQGLPV